MKARAFLSGTILIAAILAAPPAYAQAQMQSPHKAIDLSFGYEFGSFKQGFNSRSAFPVGFGVEVARDWKERRHGRLRLVGQIEGAFGPTDENAGAEGPQKFFTVTVGTRYEMKPHPGFTPFAEILIGYCHYSTMVTQFSFTNPTNGPEPFGNSGVGGLIGGGIILGHPSPRSAWQGIVVRGAVELFGASGVLGQGGGISNLQVGAFLRMKFGR